MKYMGSKARIAKYIMPIILNNRHAEQWYVEPFIGGANSMQYVDGPRIGGDVNRYTIALLRGLRDGYPLPNNITENFYMSVRDNKEKYSDFIVGLMGFCFTFGAKFFGGFVKCKTDRDRIGESIRNAEKSRHKADGVRLFCCSYNELRIPDNSIIYCDPPYANTTKYKDDFDHEKFWQWCRDKVKEGHKVFISEYSAPSDFVCIWLQELNVSVAKSGKHKKSVEKLFIHESQKEVTA